MTWQNWISCEQSSLLIIVPIVSGSVNERGPTPQCYDGARKRSALARIEMEYITVFSHHNPGAIAIAKSVLDSEGIEYIVPNEALMNIYGASVGPIEIRVPKEQSQQAHELLNSLSELDE